MRSTITIDLGAVRRNAARLLDALSGSELWAVVKADGYGHGALDVSRAVLGAGSTALCVATVPEGLALRRELAKARIVVLGPHSANELSEAREARLELVVANGALPEGVPIHLKLDTGMGRYGFPALPDPTPDTVGVMTHLATADSDPAFAEQQVARFVAARCGVALYGLSPFGRDPAEDGLEPALRWESYVAQVKLLQPGESTGYRRRFVAEQPTWIGLVPVGYGDGFRRDLTGTDVLVAGERCRTVGTISMDSFAVELPRNLEPGEPVTLIGDGILAEEHARVAGSINYELVCGINSSPERARREVVDA